MFFFSKKQVSKKALKKATEDFKKVWGADISSIWEISDKNSFLVAMSGWLNRKCNFGDNVERLSNEEKTFLVVNILEAEVNNGGFIQFLYNSSGNFANDTVPSLLAIGATDIAEICKKALAALGERIPSKTEEREDLLDDIMTDDIEEKLSKCDAEFYKYPDISDILEELNYQFIMRHKERFS